MQSNSQLPFRCCICAKHLTPDNTVVCGQMNCPCCGHLLWWSFDELGQEFRVTVDPLEWYRDLITHGTNTGREQITYQTALTPPLWERTCTFLTTASALDGSPVNSTAGFQTVGDLIAHLEKVAGVSSHA